VAGFELRLSLAERRRKIVKTQKFAVGKSTAIRTIVG
jgi:hypothetical protein